MEFKNVNERMEWEARRVAAAFGVKEWKSHLHKHVMEFRFDERHQHFTWQFDLRDNRLSFFEFDSQVDSCAVFLDRVDEEPTNEDLWLCYPAEYSQQLNERMASGLYRLGFEDESIFAQLPPLCEHEKLELRLSMPREFWPAKWLAEEQA